MKRALPEILRNAADLAAFLIPAIAYIGSVSHDPGSWDTAELQGVPYIMGISHPTGFPLWVLLGYVWSHAVVVDTVAFRMNVMSAIALAAAGGAAYALALELGARRPVALLATLWFAFTQDVWSHAIRAEAQDLAVACEALAVYAFVRWMKDGGNRWYAGAFLLVGLGMAAHPNALWVLPALAIGSFIALRRPSWKLVAGSLALVALGLSLYLYLPLRSAWVVAHGLDPTMGLTGTDGGIFWNYHNPSTLHGLLLDLTGNESNVPHYFLSSFNPLHVQDALWALISGWGDQYGAFALLLAAAGTIAMWKRDWRVTLFLVAACTAALLFAVTYQQEGDMGRYRLMALWLAVPLIATLAQTVATSTRALAGAIALALFLGIGTALTFNAHDSFFNHAPGEGGRWLISQVRPHVPPGSLLLVDWLDATSLAYGAYVDHTLPGVTIVSGTYEHAHDYPIWARTHHVYLMLDPHNLDEIPFAHLNTVIDAYHAIWEVNAVKR